MRAAPVNAPWETIQSRLEEQMRRVQDEIRNYPAPIPACDAQFNHLLEERDALSSELARVRGSMREESEPEIARGSIDAFLNDSTCLGDAEKREIRSLIKNANRHRGSD
jgi:hypothetical protein